MSKLRADQAFWRIVNTASKSGLTARWWLASAMFALCGCASQAPYSHPDRTKESPSSWFNDSAADGSSAQPLSEHWWSELHDPAIDALVDAAFADNPTLAEAVSRTDEARATLGANLAQSAPLVTANAGATRAQQQNTTGASSGSTLRTTVLSVGPNLSWELDPFGRVRQAAEAARIRVDARTLDAVAARLSLAADVANGVLSLRACETTLGTLTDEIASRETTGALTHRRLTAGFAAAADEARAQASLSSARIRLASQQEQCARQTNALVALTGKDVGTVHRQIESRSGAPMDGLMPAFMPVPPIVVAELPATVLARHPVVASADREAEAAWTDIGTAKASRLPRLNLAAVLTGEWLSAAGIGQRLVTWSIGPTLSGTLFDGGAGAANVSAAEARYRHALATLDNTLRTAVQDVENALAAQASTESRARSADDGLAAARTLLTTSEAQWRSGATSLLDLEDSRRQFATSQDAAIEARRDQAQSWIALIKATGGNVKLPAGEHLHD